MPSSPWLILACSLALSFLGSSLILLVRQRSSTAGRAGQTSPHTQATPRIGGLAAIAAFGVALTLAWQLGALRAGDIDLRQWVGVLPGLGLIALAGLLDDTCSVTHTQKLLTQFFAAAVTVGAGVQTRVVPLGGVAFTFTILYLVGNANALNLLGGMNGVADGVAAISALTLAGLAAQQGSPTLVVLALALAGAIIGFWLYNYPQVRLLMGNTGGLFLGFGLAALAALLARKPGDVPAFAAGLVAIALPIVDGAVAITRRFIRTADIFDSDREWVYDLLVRRGLSTTRATWVMYTVAVLCGVLSLWISHLPALPAMGLALGCLGALAIWAIWLGTLENQCKEVSSVQGALALTRHLVQAVVRRYTRTLILLTADILVVMAAFYSALFLRLADNVAVAPEPFIAYLYSMTNVMPFVMIVFLFANAAIGLYNRWWAYASSRDAVPIVSAGSLGGLVVLAADFLWGPARPIPVGVVLVGTVFSIGGFGLYRYRSRLLQELWASRHRSSAQPQRALIVGAGETGQLLAWKMRHDHLARYTPVAFVDDDPQKQDQLIHGVQVKADTVQLDAIAAECQADMIVLAQDDLSPDTWQTLIDKALSTPARVHVLSNALDELQAGNERGLAALRPLRAEDLLPREVHRFDLAASRQLVQGKTVLVTGAAGSIGSEISRQMAQLGAGRAVLLDNNETGLFDLRLDLGDTDRVNVITIVGDITDRNKMRTVMEAYHPQTVFHAAAYKHVPLMEDNPEEAIRVNIGGTQVMAELAVELGVEHFVLISTDKAVNPISVMGATKRIAEMIVTRMPASRTRFVVVRFGNVLGSRGSVVPVFEKQIAAGGPVTITDPAMTRYFMSIPEAVALVIQAATLAGQSGEVFVLEMGAQVNIADMARKMIRMHGLRPGVDVEIKVIGTRPGEKVHEELFCTVHGCPLVNRRQPTAVPGIFSTCNSCAPGYDELVPQVKRLRQLAQAQRNGQLHKEIKDVLALQKIPGLPATPCLPQRTERIEFPGPSSNPVDAVAVSP